MPGHEISTQLHHLFPNSACNVDLTNCDSFQMFTSLVVSSTCSVKNARQYIPVIIVYLQVHKLTYCSCCNMLYFSMYAFTVFLCVCAELSPLPKMSPSVVRPSIILDPTVTAIRVPTSLLLRQSG